MKNNYVKLVPLLINIWYSKQLRIMKLSILIFMISIIHIWANNTYSQTARISLDLKSVSVKEALDEIEKNSEFYFLYSSRLIDVNRTVDIFAEKEKIQDILTDLFVNEDINFLVMDRQIVLSPKDILKTVSTARDRESQQIVVTGKVTDEDGNPLPGVNIIIKGTSTGTITDMDGTYNIEVEDPEAILVFSFIGYGTQEVALSGRSVINITLVEEIIGMEEVIAIGYGIIKKSDMTGSVSSIEGNDIRLQAVGNPIQALAGIASGVQLLQTSGQPGSDLSLLIRGGNSILGSNEPLYVVDGTPMVSDLKILNPNDIESIEILKDASATAIYGSRGSNGVVIVTTKGGKEGKTDIEYSGYYGIQQTTKTMDMLNAEEFATLANVRAANDGMAPFFTLAEIGSFGEGTDWQDEVFQIAPIQNHSLRVSGGTSKTTFNVSGSYFNQEGIIINSGYKNLQLRARLETYIMPNWKFSLNSVLSRRENNNLHSNNTERGMGVLSAALGAPPTIPVRDEEGNYNSVIPYAFSPEGLENPTELAYSRKMFTHDNDLHLNLSTDVNILKNLVFYSSIGIQYGLGRGDNYTKQSMVTSIGSASISYSEYMDILNENILTYTKEFGANHELKIMGGFTAQKRTNQNLNASSSGFLNDILENYSLQSGSNYGTPTSSISEWTLVSYLGRFNYSYKGKYLITASLRADGSSRFGKDNKYGYFPSAAIAWRVSEEDFLIDNRLLSNLKFRASIGQTGNTNISPYQSLSTLYSNQTVFDDALYIGFAPGSAMPNPELKWETTTQINTGLDIGLFNNRLTLIADYYHKKTTDILVNIPVVYSTGYGSQVTNLGDIQNTGFEMFLNSTPIVGLFNWNIGVTLSVNRNKVIKLPGGADIMGATIGWVLPAMSLVREGEPVGVFYGYVEDGLTEEGLIKYVDLDNSGDINALDRRIIGDPNPDFIFGVNSNMSYKNFSLTILINGVYGNDILNYNLSNIGDSFSYGINQMDDVLGNYWTEENPDPNAKYPRVSEDTRFLGSDRFIEDGSYVQIKHVKLSYTLKGGRFESSRFNNSEIFISAQNLYTFTNYSFFSPIQNTLGTGISKGIDKWGYPDARTIMLGLIINL